jgi:Na+/proline symporter
VVLVDFGYLRWADGVVRLYRQPPSRWCGRLRRSAKELRPTLVLALAFASTAASGATFPGVPGLSYSYGVSVIWLAFLYPVGIYVGVWMYQRTIASDGNRFGARSIPE